MAEAEASLPSLMRGVTLEFVVTGQREAKARMWLGGLLIKLGARVMGCGVEITAESTETDIIRYQPMGGGPEQFVLGRRIRG